MSEGIRRSERIRRMQLERSMASDPIPPGRTARALFILDTSSARPTRRRRIVPQVQIFSGPSFDNRTIFMPLNSSNRRNGNSLVRAVLLRGPATRPSNLERIRYTSFSQWAGHINLGPVHHYPDDITGVFLMAMIADPSLETHMRSHPSRTMSILLRIAAYFLN
uniref:Uncharacterized protein LOC108041120 n=1 Tax=Drosophila rhopaloa TaxID=1041015 RepID=A0A6P4EMB5_DRORH